LPPTSAGMPPGQGDEVPPRLRRDAERNRHRILQAAAEVFGERGLEATLNDVAHHAGVGVGTVYRRFPDKETLAEALFTERIDALIAIAEHGMSEPDPWTGLVLFFERIVAVLAEDRGLRQVLMSTGFGGARVTYARERLVPLVRSLFERAQAAGQLRADLRGADWPFIEFMLNAVVESSRHVRPELWRRYLTLVLDGMRAHRETPTTLPEPPLAPEEMTEATRSWPLGRH